MNKVVANTKEISQCTHADPRCTASCIAVTTAVSDRMTLGGFIDEKFIMINLLEDRTVGTLG